MNMTPEQLERILTKLDKFFNDITAISDSGYSVSVSVDNLEKRLKKIEDSLDYLTEKVGNIHLGIDTWKLEEGVERIGTSIEEAQGAENTLEQIKLSVGSMAESFSDIKSELAFFRRQKEIEAHEQR